MCTMAKRNTSMAMKTSLERSRVLYTPERRKIGSLDM